MLLSSKGNDKSRSNKTNPPPITEFMGEDEEEDQLPVVSVDDGKSRLGMSDASGREIPIDTVSILES